MARRSLLTSKTRQELFGIPEGPKQLTRFYTLSREDHGLIRLNGILRTNLPMGPLSNQSLPKALGGLLAPMCRVAFCCIRTFSLTLDDAF